MLMHARGARRLRRYHLGLWADVGGVAHVLHCQDGAGSILHPIRDLGLRALELEGIYRWRLNRALSLEVPSGAGRSLRSLGSALRRAARSRRPGLTARPRPHVAKR